MTQQKDEMLLIGLIEADKLTMIIVILEAIWAEADSDLPCN